MTPPASTGKTVLLTVMAPLLALLLLAHPLARIRGTGHVSAPSAAPSIETIPSDVPSTGTLKSSSGPAQFLPCSAGNCLPTPDAPAISGRDQTTSGAATQLISSLVFSETVSSRL